MLRAVSVALCLILPTAAFADELQSASPPSSDQPTQQTLTPSDPAAPAPDAVQQARWCGAHGGCSGGRGKAKWIVIGGVAGTVITAVAVGLAVGFATRNNGTPVTP
jgi:hypothetical protein